MTSSSVRRWLLCGVVIAIAGPGVCEAQTWWRSIGPGGLRQFAVECDGGRVTIVVSADPERSPEGLRAGMASFSVDDLSEIPRVPGRSPDIVFEIESCRVPEYRIEVRADAVGYFWLTVDASGDVRVREQDEITASQGRRPTSRPTIYVPTDIYYATDRQRAASSHKTDFLNQRSADGALSRGRVIVNVAKEIVAKQPVVPETAPGLVRSETPLSPGQWRTEVLRGSERGARRDVLVFVHGYNVSFSGALEAVASFAEELKFTGAVVAYSWPSEFSELKYVADLDHSRLSAINLQEFFEELADMPNVGRIHIVAHSMGSDAVLEAVVRASLKSRPTRFGHLIFVAADVDPDRFARVAPAIRAVSDSISLYVSSHDLALGFSKTIRAGARRLGDAAPSPVVVDGVDTIDASDTQGGAIGHSYYLDTRMVRDMRSLLVDGKPARDRGLVRAPGGYYTLR